MKVFEFDSVSSTMDVALEIASSSSLPFLVIAKYQSRGRGRGNNSWQSVSEGFYGTFVFSQPQKSLDGLSVYIGYSIIVDLGLVSAFLKWPNDLLTYELKKFGGILIELHDLDSCSSEVYVKNTVVSEGNKTQNIKPKLLLIGIGLNIETDNEQFGTLRQAGFQGSREELIERLIQSVSNALNVFMREDFRLPAEDIWLRMCFRNQLITVGAQKERLVCVGLTSMGHLVCYDDNGQKREIVSATEIRPCE